MAVGHLQLNVLTAVVGAAAATVDPEVAVPAAVVATVDPEVAVPAAEHRHAMTKQCP